LGGFDRFLVGRLGWGELVGVEEEGLGNNWCLDRSCFTRALMTFFGGVLLWVGGGYPIAFVVWQGGHGWWTC